MSFDVACSPEHAFRVWTSRIGTWWPPDHTVSGQAGLASSCRAASVAGSTSGPRDGRRARLGEGDHLGASDAAGLRVAPRPGPADATEVEIRFRAQGASATRVEIEHRGWERLGTGGRGVARPEPGWLGDAAPALSCRHRKRRQTDGCRDQRRSVGTQDAAGTSEYTMYQDEQADPPALVCQVGSTTLKYHLRAIDDLHAWLVEQGDWVLLGAADEKKPAARAPSRRGGVTGQPGRRLVRPTQRLPRPVRDVPPAALGGARPGRSHPRAAQQLDASVLKAVARRKSLDPVHVNQYEWR